MLSLLYLFPWTLLHQVLPSLNFMAFFFSSHLTSLKILSLYQLFFWCGYSGSSTYHHSICSPQVFNSIYTFLNKCLIIHLKVWPQLLFYFMFLIACSPFTPCTGSSVLLTLPWRCCISPCLAFHIWMSLPFIIKFLFLSQRNWSPLLLWLLSSSFLGRIGCSFL